jgi:hypothetical protein
MVRVAASLLVLLFVSAAPVSAQTARLLVTVIDRATRAPLPDVRVQLFHDGRPTMRDGLPYPNPTLITSAQTDALGMATISITLDVYPQYYIRATHKQYFPTEPEFRPMRLSEGDIAVGIELFPRDFYLDFHPGEPTEIVNGRLVGQVSTSTGEAMPNILITALAQSGFGVNASTHTGNDGSYSLPLRPGDYRISAAGDRSASVAQPSLPDYSAYPVTEQTTVRIVSGRGTRADMVLNPVPTVNLTVRVTDDLGDSVSNADVFALSERGNSSTMVAGLTGEDGSVKIGRTSPGEVGLLIHATKEERYLIAKAKIEIQDRPLTVTMSLVPSGIITGRVEFVGRVEPLHSPGGLRVIQTVPGRSIPAHTITGTSGQVTASGEFKVTHLLGEQCLVLDGITSGWRLVDVTHNGQDYTNRAFRLEAGQIIDGVVFRVEPGTSEYSRPVCAR